MARLPEHRRLSGWRLPAVSQYAESLRFVETGDCRMSEVLEINDVEDLAGFRLVWQSLLQRTRGASFFQTLDWLECVARRYGSAMRFRILIVSSAGETIGILPLVVMREQTRMGSMNVLTYPLHYWGTFYGPIGPNPTATLLVAMRYLAARRRDWDLLDLRWICAERDGSRSQLAMQTAGLQGVSRAWETTHIVDVNQTWDDYLASRTSKFRNNLRRSQRRVRALGELTFERHRPDRAACGDGDPRWDLYEECVDLAARSWQGSSLDGTTLSHAEVADFFRDTHAAASRCGMLDVAMLRLDGRPIAFGYNYHHEGDVTGMRIGYDPDLRKIGIGTLLYAASIEDSCRREDLTFDLGTGYGKMKSSWITRLVTSRRVTHYQLTAPTAQLLRLSHWYKHFRPGGALLSKSQSL